MSYIDLINQFWRMNNEHRFTPNEMAVYFALLRKCNELGWKNPFNESNETLAMQVNMAVNSMKRARKYLQEKGMIEFTSTHGRRLYTNYQIKLSLNDSFKIKQPIKQPIKLSGDDSYNAIKQPIKLSNADTNIRLRRKDEDEERNPPSSPPKTFPISDCRNMYDYHHQAAKEIIRSSNGIMKEKIHLFQNEFDDWLISSGKTEKELSDYTDHFAKWMGKLTPERKQEVYQKAIKPKKEISIIEKYS